MGWLDYYRLLEKYDADLSRATREELRAAKAANPNNPVDALVLAWKEYQRRKKRTVRLDHPDH